MKKETKNKHPIFRSRSWGDLSGWIAEPKLFWWLVFVIFAASLLGDWLGELIGDVPRADRIRYSGWLLDAVGIFGVSVGINRKLNLFHGSTVWRLLKENFRDWMGRFPLARHHRSIIAASGSVSVSGAAASLRATAKIDPRKSLEDKVTFLLKRNDEITDQLFDMQEARRAGEQSLSGELKDLQSALRDEIAKVERRRAEAHVGAGRPRAAPCSLEGCHDVPTRIRHPYD